MKKNLGLVLLTAGIGITAGFGSYLSPAFKVEMVKTGEAHFASELVAKRHKSYCKARRKADLPYREDCKNKKGKGKDLVGAKKLEGRSPLKRNKFKLKALQRSTEALPVEVAKKRKKWVKALKNERKMLKAAKAVGTQGPGPRLSGWGGLVGGPFGLGLLLVIAGSVLCRQAIRDELVGGGDGSEDGPVDFGVLLEDVLGRARSLQQEMVALEAPTEADLDAIKAKLEDLQKGDLARLCTSGPKVQQRYGMTGFAEIFSPLSAGERKLNRLWATLVDRHWPEALASAEAAVRGLEAAAQATRDQAAG